MHDRPISVALAILVEATAQKSVYLLFTIAALEKIRGHNTGEMDVSEAVSHMFFVDPNRSALDALYATHPPVDERIRRLREM